MFRNYLQKQRMKSIDFILFRYVSIRTKAGIYECTMCHPDYMRSDMLFL